jgi:hypothetical protein
MKDEDFGVASDRLFMASMAASEKVAGERKPLAQPEVLY